MEYQYDPRRGGLPPSPQPAPTGGGSLFTGEQYRNPAVAPRPIGMAGTPMSYSTAGGMGASGPGSYISPGAKMMSRAGQMGAGNFSRPGSSFSQDARVKLDAMEAERQMKLGGGARPGAMPPMSAVAMARMQRPNQPIDPSDPKNAALAGYR